MCKATNKFIIKTKIVNHLTQSGKKNIGEKLLLNSCKKLQKSSAKRSNHTIVLALNFLIPIFKIHQWINKKSKRIYQTPTIIQTLRARISLAIKFIARSTWKKQSRDFYSSFYEELLSTAKTKSSSIELKKQLQKQVLLKKHILFYYRWK